MKRNRKFRRNETERVTAGRVRLLKELGARSKEGTPHLYHKRHPFDCGNTNCGSCRVRERSLDHKYRADLSEDLEESWDYNLTDEDLGYFYGDDIGGYWGYFYGDEDDLSPLEYLRFIRAGMGQLNLMERIGGYERCCRLFRA